MGYRAVVLAAMLATGLAAPTATGQEYSPGRPVFTLGDKLKQLMGDTPKDNVAPATPQRTTGQRTNAQQRPPTGITYRPNYHHGKSNAAAKAAEEPAAVSSSSRRTSQPAYRPAPTEPAAEPVAQAPAKQNVQPRTLQEALFGSRITPEPRMIEASPPVSPKPKATATASAPTSSFAAPPPAPQPKSIPPKSVLSDAPPRVARAPKPPVVVEEPAPVGPAFEELEQPKPLDEVGPVIEKATPIARTSGDALIFTQKSPVLTVEAKGPRRTAMGKETKVKIVMRNTGDVAAHDVLLVVQIPAGAEVVGANPTTGDARLPAGQESPVLRWSMADVPARSQEELELTLVARKNESLDLGVQWTFAPDSQQFVIDVQEPRLQMQIAGPKEVAYGEKVIYKLTFSNPGNADAENVVVTLPAIGGDGPSDSHTIGSIKAGETKVVEMELVARQTGRISIKAMAESDSGLKAAVNQEVTVRRAGIKVELEGPKTQYARTNVTYKVTVTNNGNAAASDVMVAAQLPPRAKYVSSTEGGQAAGERVSWTLSLEPGQQQVLQFKCQLDNPGTNRVQAAAVYGDLKDLATLSTDVQAVADLVLSVVEPEGVFAVGEEVTYEVRIKNRGTTTASGVNAVCFFSDGIEATSATGARYEISAGKITFQSIPSISAEKEAVLKVKARASVAGNHVFRAEVQCTSLGSKLAQEGTTRFFEDESATSDGAKEKPAASSSDSSSSSNSSSGTDRSNWTGSSRRRGTIPDTFAPPEPN